MKTETWQSVRRTKVCEIDFPLENALSVERSAIAVITGIEGTSYRPLGATMAIDHCGRSWGSLTSGCIERDIIHHALNSISSEEAVHLRYGRGSPFFDMGKLPCGGALDVTVMSTPRSDAFMNVPGKLRRREAALVPLNFAGETILEILVQPQIRLLVFGTGVETRIFAELAQCAGYIVETFSPSIDVIEGLPGARRLLSQSWPEDVLIDERTAIVMFFHDHGWETELLVTALGSPAFLVGAQGSANAHNSRREALRSAGVSSCLVEKLQAPFGLIPSTRQPDMLAVSVLAQIVQVLSSDQA